MVLISRFYCKKSTIIYNLRVRAGFSFRQFIQRQIEHLLDPQSNQNDNLSTTGEIRNAYVWLCVYSSEVFSLSCQGFGVDAEHIYNNQPSLGGYTRLLLNDSAYNNQQSYRANWVREV